MAHIPVMLNECIDKLNINPRGTYLDMTLGGFGHGRAICERLGKDGWYIGIDKDPAAISRAEKQKNGLICRTDFIHSDYEDFENVLSSLGVALFDGCLMDLGVSSFQLDEAERGFSFIRDGKLDMRMDTDSDFSAYDVVNSYTEAALCRILRDYAQERFAPRIAQRIAEAAKLSPIKTTGELAGIVAEAIPKKFHQKGKNPATRTFQAIRIEVNGELNALNETICSAAMHLSVGGRIAILSFHSLEDKIVKNAFSELARGCTCPKEFPVCVCGNKPKIKVFSALTAREEELSINIRARSARLRSAERL